MAVSFTKTDLEYLLTQIQMAETNTPPVSPHLAFGLREVAGTNNNQVPGQGTFGASDQTFPTVTQQYYQTVNVDGTFLDPDDSHTGDMVSYVTTTPGAPSNFGTNVIDGAPRTISNLIADISLNNPAAVQAAQAFAAQLGDGYTVFSSNPTGLILPGADGVFGTVDDAWGKGADNIDGNADDLWGADGVLGGGDDIAAPDFQNLFVGNITPDAGLSAPFNSWMTFFGQFFDHGLDLISKGGAGVVMIPLAADDPLITVGADGIAGTGDEVTNPAQQFMALTRATNIASTDAGADGIVGTQDDIHYTRNTTTPFVDQNQTYSSHPSHQVFLREYVTGSDGNIHSTGRLLTHAAGRDGIAGNADDNSGMATWADLKANALKLGIVLTDYNVGNVPLILTDAYGNFIRNAFGGVTVVTASGNVAMNPAAPSVLPANTTFIDHAFLDDIAHAATPFSSSGALKAADTDGAPGLANIDATPTAGFYDNELLNAHYVAGDGRVNENIALTTVHEIFHEEHNRLVNHIKSIVQAELANGDTAFASQWVVAGANLANGIQDNEWNGERLFQAAKFGTETQYQHLVFEEFARKVAPTIHLFGNVDINLDPAITSEFANAVYRFGHSMLDQNVPLFETNSDGTMVIGPDGQPVLTNMGLIEAFLNPLAFASMGTDAAQQIAQGSIHQIGSEIDEFVTGALRNNLLGLPLDLASLNLARARDTGVAPLNMVRAQIYDATGDQTLKPYSNWAEFGQFLKHEGSLVNFVAAYGQHSSITSATTLAAKRAAAATLVADGLNSANVGTDAYDFMHSTGAWANNTRNAGGDAKLNTADDTWSGGVNSSKAMMNIDPGLDHLFGTSDDVVHAAMWATGSVTGVDNIDLWIGGLAEKQNLFGGLLGSTFNFIFETQLENLQDADRLYYLPRIEGMDFGFQIENNSFADMIIANTGAKHIPASIFLTPEYTVEAGSVTNNPATWLKNPVTGAYLVEKLADGTVHFIGDDNFFGNTIVLGGTAGDDRLQAGHADDDTVWGDAGNDWIDGGNGNDFLYGGTGNDTIVDSGGFDVIHGEEGNDSVYAGDGDDIVFLGEGNDYAEGGFGIDAIQGGAGNDIIKGGEDDDELIGNQGDDWLEGGAGGDMLVGDHGAPTGQIPLIQGNDVLIGGATGDRMMAFSGDDIMVGEGGFDTFNGGLGFDWATFEFETSGVSVDMNKRDFIPDPTAPAGQATRSVFIETEGISGSKYNDVLVGTNTAVLNPQFNELTNVNLIQNLDTFFAAGPVAFSNGDIMLGGDGSDLIQGGAGNDIIDGDAWMHVALSGDGKAGSEIIRQIRWDITGGDIDTAVFTGNFSEYSIGFETDAQGFITVTHNVLNNGGGNGGGGGGGGNAGIVALVNEGVDKLRNIERIQFADQTLLLDTSPGANQVATGALVITGDTDLTTAIVDPTVGQVLTVNRAAIADAEGINEATVHFQWQVQDPARPDWVNIAGATSATFTPSNQHIALPLRVVMTFTDNAGVQERVVSAPTGLTLPDLTQNTAPFIVPQQGVTGLPDTNALTNKPFDLFLPLITTFGDHETNPALLNYTATLSNGAALSTVGLSFTTVPDGAGGISGAHITGTATTSGPISIRVTATDGGPGTPLSVTDTFIINVQQPTGQPTTSAVVEAFTGSEDVQKTGTLLAGSDPDGDPLGFRLVQNSAVNGAVSINATTGQFLFNPSADFSGVASFQYYVTDGLYNSAPKTVTINFAPVDDGTADVYLTGTAAVGGTLGAVIGFDPDGEILSGSETYQWLIDGAEISGATNATYTVVAGDVGHNISVKVIYTDGQGNVNNGTSGNLPAAESQDILIGTLGVTGVTGNNTPTMIADSTIVDPDGGPTTVDYVWETSTNGTTWVPAAGTISGDTSTFSPTGTTTSAGAFVRVRATYVDEQGNLEEIQGDAAHYIVNGTGNGVITGTTARDLIWGQGGGDQITAGLGDDFVQAGSGNDTIFASVNDGDDIYDGGTGTDTYVMTSTAAAANVDLSAGTASSSDTGTDQLISIENVTGSSGDNILVGSNGSNTLTGNGGNDQITGLGGGDTLDGGIGNDTFFFTIGDGNDSYVGGTGSDTIDLSGITGNTTINLASGFSNGTQIGSDSLTGIENVIGGSGNDTITGNTQANVFRGGAGNDSISAGNGNDTFVAVAGDGNDNYNGQGGTDTLDLSGITTSVTVRLDLGTATGSQIGNDTLNNIEQVVGGSAGDFITAGTAPELLTGNGGADTFFFRSVGAAGSGAGSRTIITDFVQGSDVIDLTFIDSVVGGVNDAFTFDSTVNAGSGLVAAGQIGFYISGGNTIIEGNISGDPGAVDFQIELTGVYTLTLADFHP